jgi:hypothetical protein
MAADAETSVASGLLGRRLVGFSGEMIVFMGKGKREKGGWVWVGIRSGVLGLVASGLHQVV